MASTNNKITDHNVLDKSQSKANVAVMQHVKNQREHLQSGEPASSLHLIEMLKLHTQNVLEGAAIGPLFVIAVGLTDYYFYHSPSVAIWSAVTCGFYIILTLVAQSTSKIIHTDKNRKKLTYQYYAIYLAIGICWAVFFSLESASATTGNQFFFYSAALLILVAFVTTSNFALPLAALFTILPVLVVSAIQTFFTHSVLASSSVAVQVIAAAFFMLLGRKIYQSNLARLDHQAEKDALIAELEVASAMSEEARRRAEEANLAKSRFLASMSHELRTPLNAILGFSEIMKNGVMGKINIPIYVEYTNDIHSSGQHLLNLINEILDLSRIEAGRYELNEESISLKNIVVDCIAMIQLKARNKKIKLVEVFEADLPDIWADEKAIRQVILNLLSNAVKFTPKYGEIKFKLGWTAGGGQYFSVIDNGTGIAEEEIPIVLSAFGQGSIAIKSAEQGTGLGLPIVQAIMNKHDGNFTLQSKLRVGTTATCLFPASRVMRSVSPVEQTNKASRQQTQHTKKLVRSAP